MQELTCTKEILELPGSLQHSELQFFTPNSDQALSLPRSMAWITGLAFLLLVFPLSTH